MVCGGSRVGEKGYFIQPTIFADVETGMKIHDEEIFGPVLSVIKFKVCSQKLLTKEIVLLIS